MIGFLTALQFLTILPIRVKSKELAKSLAFFPLVGLFIGVCLVVLEFILTYSLPTSVIRLILIVFLVIITGGLHIDGFADTVDAVASREKGKRALEVMHESTVGPIAVAGVSILLLAKYISLGEFFGWRLYAMLLLFPMVGRMAMVTMCWMFSCAREEGIGKAFIDNAGPKEFAIAGIISFIVGLLLYGIRGMAILGCTILMVVFFGRYFTKRFGGITGDMLGFINELGELVALLGGTVIV